MAEYETFKEYLIRILSDKDFHKAVLFSFIMAIPLAIFSAVFLLTNNFFFGLLSIFYVSFTSVSVFIYMRFNIHRRKC